MRDGRPGSGVGGTHGASQLWKRLATGQGANEQSVGTHRKADQPKRK
jgi:hypothetical protein